LGAIQQKELREVMDVKERKKQVEFIRAINEVRYENNTYPLRVPENLIGKSSFFKFYWNGIVSVFDENEVGTYEMHYEVVRKCLAF
jgi:hypothetical protein